ncbi:unnamed protein product [Pleuronectes platessa]|uniref:Uncharacterized protein n=1 Tax=Pleuronectes platessa TaxID=8262 RepID=A0A9N7UUE7_PLEPL|nr:unnamed protein product [Pleuronectes platessa]
MAAAGPRGADRFLPSSASPPCSERPSEETRAASCRAESPPRSQAASVSSAGPRAPRRSVRPSLTGPENTGKTCKTPAQVVSHAYSLGSLLHLLSSPLSPSLSLHLSPLNDPRFNLFLSTGHFSDRSPLLVFINNAASQIPSVAPNPAAATGPN